MKNIKILKTGIDVSKIRKQLEKYPEDWGSQKGLKAVSYTHLTLPTMS